MRKISIALSILFLLYCFNLTHIPKTHGQTHQRSGIWDAAEKVWRGNYSLEDLPKWSKKLERAKSMNKWLGVSLCHNVIGVMHYYEGNLDRALGHINQSLHIDRENGFKKMIMRDLLWIGQIQKIKGLNEKALIYDYCRRYRQWRDGREKSALYRTNIVRKGTL